MHEFTYHINLNERDEFYAHVEDEGGNAIFAIASVDHLGEMIEDGYMKHGEDIGGLAWYLRSMGIIGPKDIVVFEEN